MWLPARAAASFPELNFHDLKDTAGTALLDEEVNIKVAQVRLGHANPRTTLAVYGQATAEADRVGDRLKPPANTNGATSHRLQYVNLASYQHFCKRLGVSWYPSFTVVSAARGAAPVAQRSHVSPTANRPRDPAG